MPDRPFAAPSLSRRTALLGLAASVLAAGCDHGDDIGEPAASGSPSAPTASTSAPVQTPDEALVDEVLAELDAALGVLGSARRLRAMRAAVTPVLRAHRKHVQALGREPEVTTSDPLAAATASQAVRRSETRLQAALVDAAGRAESGALAKLLASMSASTTQHVASLPKEAS